MIQCLWLPTAPALVAMYLLVVYATNELDLSVLTSPRITQGLAAIALLVALGTVPYFALRRPIEWIRHDLLLHREARTALHDVRRWQRHQAARESEYTRFLVDRACARLRQALGDGSPSRVYESLNELDFAMGGPVPIGRRGVLQQYLRSIGSAVLIALSCRWFIVDAYQIPSGAMLPTLQYGDHILLSRIRYGLRIPFRTGRLFSERAQPQRGDVVVFALPQQPSAQAIGRVIALPGDRIRACGGELRINDRPLPRELLQGRCEYNDYGGALPRRALRPTRCTAYRERNGDRAYLALYHEGGGRASAACESETVVPPAHVYVMSDNREDGYFAGSLPIDNLAGKAWIVFWSAGEKTSIRTDRMFIGVAP